MVFGCLLICPWYLLQLQHRVPGSVEFQVEADEFNLGVPVWQVHTPKLRSRRRLTISSGSPAIQRQSYRVECMDLDLFPGTRRPYCESNELRESSELFGRFAQLYSLIAESPACQRAAEIEMLRLGPSLRETRHHTRSSTFTYLGCSRRHAVRQVSISQYQSKRNYLIPLSIDSLIDLACQQITGYFEYDGLKAHDRS